MNESAILRFQTLLEADLECLQRVLTLLQAERRALEKRELDTLERVTIDKTLLLDALDRTAGERESLLCELGVAANAEALVAFFAHPDVLALAPNMESTWEQLRALLREVRHENTVNGQVINRSRQTIATLVNVIRGQVGQRETYDQRGLRQTGTSGAEIARA